MSSTASPSPPQQQRSRESMGRVLDATQQLITERGTAAVTISEVASRAGVAVGTVYRRFSGRDALIDAVQERWMNQVIIRLTPGSIGAPPRDSSFEDFVASYVASLVSTFGDNAELLRELILRTISTPSDTPARRMLQASFNTTCQAVWDHPGRPVDTDRQAVDLAFRAVQATLEWRVTTPVDRAPDNDWESLAHELPLLALSYLRH